MNKGRHDMIEEASMCSTCSHNTVTIMKGAIEMAVISCDTREKKRVRMDKDSAVANNGTHDHGNKTSTGPDFESAPSVKLYTDPADYVLNFATYNDEDGIDRDAALRTDESLDDLETAKSSR